MKKIGLLMMIVAVFMARTASADDLPWDGTRLVFGEEHCGGVYTLDEEATVSEVDFLAPATLQGAALTLTPPALVRGSGALLTPLAGTDGVGG